MSMIVEEEASALFDPVAEAASRVEARYSIARDAVVNEKQHSDEAVGQFFDALFGLFEVYKVAGADEQPLDELVLDLLQRMKPARNYYFQLVEAMVNSRRNTDLHRANREFLGRALAYKHAPRDVVRFNHLWCDHYRFILREMFIGVTALLISSRDFEEANRYLAAEYRFETDRGPQTANFLRFDAYIKSLDEFRTRRLRQKRLSVTADVLKQRADLSFLSFDEMMQADLVLCLRGLLHHTNELNQWFPRSLAYAEPFLKSGFDLFFSAQSKREFVSIQTLLQVKNKRDLIERFEQAAQQRALDQWKLGDLPIPFAALMGLEALRK